VDVENGGRRDGNSVYPQFRKLRDRGINLIRRTRLPKMQLQVERASCGLKVAHMARSGRAAGREQDSDAGQAWIQFLQEFNALRVQHACEIGDAGNVSTWPRQRRDQPHRHRVKADREAQVQGMACASHEPMSALLRGLCVATVILCYGCVPIPIITADRPGEITPHVSAELAAPSLELMVVPVTSRDKVLLTLDEPIFVKASDIVGFESNLERTSLHAVVIGMFGGGAGTVTSNKVQEVCLIASNGQTMNLARTDKGWSPSVAVPIDPAWKSQFIALLTQTKPTTLLPIWKSAPCRSFDWAGLDLKWDGEHRNRAVQFLRRLPPE
jgi:hypothetical protein